MNNIPYNYFEQSMAAGFSYPNSIKLNSVLFNFYVQQLYNRVISNYKLNIPEKWEYGYFVNCLFWGGYILIFKDQKVGVIPQWGEVYELNFFYYPKKFSINNALLTKTNRIVTINEDCVAVKINPNYRGISDIIYQYAAQLAILQEALNINAYNTKSTRFFFADNKQEAESYKAAVDKANRGEPAVVVGKSLETQLNKNLWESNLKNYFIVDDIQLAIKNTENHFDKFIGIESINYDKKEHYINLELELSNKTNKNLAILWYNNIKKGLEEANKMFNLNCSIEWVENNGLYNNYGAV